MEEAKGLWDLSQDYLDSAKANRISDPPRLSVAFAETRHAIELMGKAMLLHQTGTYPRRRHNVAGAMARHGLIPPQIDSRRLAQVMDQFTRGEYGYDQVPTSEEIEEAIAMADALSAFAPSF